MDYYAIVDVPRKAAAVIRTTYKQSAQIGRIHPTSSEHNVREEATKRLAMLTVAYDRCTVVKAVQMGRDAARCAPRALYQLTALPCLGLTSDEGC